MKQLKNKYWVDYLITATLHGGKEISRTLRAIVHVDRKVTEPYLRAEIEYQIENAKIRYLHLPSLKDLSYADVMKAQVQVMILRYNKASADILEFKPVN